MAFQVLDLGVTRYLVQWLVEVFPKMCDGDLPLAGTDAATRRVCNLRLDHVGRRSKACRTAPGYVCSRPLFPCRCLTSRVPLTTTAVVLVHVEWQVVCVGAVGVQTAPVQRFLSMRMVSRASAPHAIAALLDLAVR